MGELDPATFDLLRRLPLLRDAQKSVPGYAGYFNEPAERAARERFLRGLGGMKHQREIVPGSVDTYQEGAVGRNFRVGRDAGLEMPIRLFEPPR